MACAIGLLVYANVVAAALGPADAVGPTSQVEMINGLIPSGPSTVYNDSNYYVFPFTYTMAVNPECCKDGYSWAYTTECWEDDTFSDDFIGIVGGNTVECGAPYSDAQTPAVTWQGTYMHAQCGTGSDWEMEYWFDSMSPACGSDLDIDPADWQREQPNQRHYISCSGLESRGWPWTVESRLSS